MTPFPDSNTAQTLQAMPDAVIAVDSKGEIRFLNSAAEDLTGHMCDELLGESIDVIVPTSKRVAHSLQRSRYHAAPSTRPMGARAELQLRRKDGVLIPVEINFGPLACENDGIFLSTIRDVSAQERRSREEILVSEIGRIVNSDREIQGVYDALAALLPALVKYDRLAINLNHPGSDLVRREFVSGVQVAGGAPGTEGPPPTDAQTAPGPTPGSSLAGRPVGSEPLMKAMAAIGLNSWVEVPLGNPIKPIGYLSLRSFQRDAYNDDDFRVLEKVAAQISPAIENAHLYARVREEARLSTALAEISRVITSTSDVEEVYSLVADQIRKILPFDRIVVATVDGSRNLVTDRYVAGLLVDGGVANVTYPLDDSTVGEMLDDPHPRWFRKDEIEELARRYPADKSRVEAGLNSMLTVPLVWHDEAVGRIILRSRDENAYGDIEAANALKIANQISGAVANADLVTRLRREGDERAALAEISRIITSTSDIEKVYTLVADQIRDLVQFDRIVVSTIDRSRNLVTDRYVAGLQMEGGEAGTTHELDNSFTGELLQDPRARWLTGIEVEKYGNRYPGDASRAEAGLRSILAVPLIWDDEVIGMLILRSRNDTAYGEPEAITAIKIANQISGAIANAEMVARLRRESDERATLAEISRVVTSDENLERVYDKFADCARRLIPFDLVIVRTLDDQRENVVDRYVRGTAIHGLEPGRSVPFPGSAAEETISGTLPRMISRSEAESWAGRHPELIPSLHAGMHSFLLAPLTWNGVTNGVLAMSALGEDAFDERHIELAGRIADQISGAILNARSHEAALLAEKERLASETRERELELLNEQRSSFLSTVSHELKTPLTSVVAFADVLAKNRDSNLTERQLQQIHVVQRSARRLDLLINDLLDVSKLDAGTFKLNKQEFDVEVLLKEIADAFAPIVQRKRQTIEVNHGNQQIWLCGDRDRVAQVISNLLSNAAKYSGDEHVITLSAEAESGALTFAVKDSGIGLSEEDQQNLFTPFFRASNEATQAEAGSGLGLVIVKSIVELHGGDVSLESKEGVGTTVSVTFPDCTDAPSEAYLEAQRTSVEPVAPHSRLG